MTLANPRRVLVVDDDAQMLRATGRLLGALGAHCTAVENLPGATQAVKTGAWDAMLIDLNLSEGNCLDLIPVAFANLAMPPVILMSGNASVDDLGRAVRLPVVDFLNKPFGLADLAKALDRAWACPTLKPRLAAPNLNMIQHVVGILGQLEREGPDAIGPQLTPLEDSARFVGGRTTWVSATGRAALPASLARSLRTLASDDEVGSMFLGSALIGTAWSVEGPWAQTAAGWTLQAVRAASQRRTGPSGDLGELTGLLQAIGPLTLMAAARSSSEFATPGPALVQRMEAMGAAVGRRMLQQYAIPEGLARRVELNSWTATVPPPADAAIPVARVPARPAARAASWVAQPPPVRGGGGEPDLTATLSLAIELERATRGPTPIQGWPGWSRLVSGAFALPTQLRVLAPRRVDVAFEDAEEELLQQLADDARVAGIWLEVGRARDGHAVKAPVELSNISGPLLTGVRGPTTATLRVVGAPHHEDALRAHIFSGLNRRRSVRVAADPKQPMRACISGGAGAPRLDAVIRDMSLDGIGLVLLDTRGPVLPVQEIVDLTLFLPDGGEPVLARARVARARKIQGSLGPGSGTLTVVECGLELYEGGMDREAGQRWVATVMMRQRAALRAEQELRT